MVLDLQVRSCGVGGSGGLAPTRCLQLPDGKHQRAWPNKESVINSSVGACDISASRQIIKRWSESCCSRHIWCVNQLLPRLPEGLMSRFRRLARQYANSLAHCSVRNSEAQAPIASKGVSHKNAHYKKRTSNLELSPISSESRWTCRWRRLL